MLGKVRLHAQQCLHIIMFIYIVGKVFLMLPISLLYPNQSFTYNSKQLRGKDFSMEQLPIDSCYYVYKLKHSVSIN